MSVNEKFFKQLKINFNIDLNSQQKEAVSQKDGPLLILSGPGSGKTTVIVCRTANLILNHGVNPNEILTMTFSRAAARDMQDRFERIFGSIVKVKVRFSTIHSFAFFVLRDYGKMTGVRYQLIEGAESPVNKLTVLKQIYKECNGEYINEDKLEELQNTIGYVKNAMMTKDEMNKCKWDIPNLIEVIERYEVFKRSRNYMDFDDMLVLAYEALKTQPRLLDLYRGKYKYIQVDEAQDTSKIQNQIINIIAKPRNNIALVCDDDQTIYGFRGSNPEYLFQFEKIYANVKKFFIEQNYRSNENIVGISNLFIKNNKKRFNKNLFTKNSKGNPIRIIDIQSEDNQVNYIIQRITSKDGMGHNAVLYRDNLSALPLINELFRRNIKFYLRDYNPSFFSHWVLLDLIAFIKLAMDMSNVAAFERIFYKMDAYISRSVIETIKQMDSEKTVFDRCRDCGLLKSYQINRLYEIQHNFNRMAFMKPTTAIQTILIDLGYDKYLQDNSEKLGYSYGNTKVVVSAVKGIANNIEKLQDIEKRLPELQELMESAKFNKNKTNLTLSTIHSAKGLEFDNVYLINMIDGVLPTQEAIKKLKNNVVEDIEEERRVFYVGITRARFNLEILVPKYKDELISAESMFVREIKNIIKPLKNDGQKNEMNEKPISKRTVSECDREGKTISVNVGKLKKGDIVRHKKFGIGEVVGNDGDNIEINFYTEGKRVLKVDICRSNSLLTTA